MNEIVTNTANLPANIEDLSKFVLVGREKLTAVRAEIRAIQKVGLAKEVHEQKLREAQDIADAVLDAEVRIGELTRAMPKAQGFASSILPTDGKNVKTKTEQHRHKKNRASAAGCPSSFRPVLRSFILPLR